MNAATYNVLIVEDNAEDRYIFKRKLQGSSTHSFKVTEARTGLEGLEKCNSTSPDCILLDYNLPDLNGVEFINRLREEIKGDEPAIVMLTGLGSETLAVEALKAGAQDYLVKGLDQERIFQAIAKAIENVDHRRQLTTQALQVQALLRERENLIFELEQRARDLAEVDRRKDIFLATLAHELRNPLAPIRSSMDLLKFKFANDKDIAEIQQIVARQVDHLTSLVNDLTDVARITTGKVALKREIITLDSVIARTLELCSAVLDYGQHTVKLSCPDEKVLLNADPVRLVQILVNILTNASKYTLQPGEIEFTARVDGNIISFTITDPGIGLEASSMDAIFDIFTQVGNANGRKQDGLGIGLSLAKQFAELHGGNIYPASKGLNSGSEFTVTLPIVVNSLEATNFPLSAPGKDANHSVNSNCQVLVVDDNVDAADALHVLFQAYGYNAIKAYNGKDAIELALKHKPRIIVMDLGMAGIDGLEAIRQIRQQPDGHLAVAIALTGWNMDSIKRETLQSGFNYHIVKPVDFEKLNALLTHASPGIIQQSIEP